MIAPDPDDPDIVYGGRVDKLDLRTGQTRSIDPDACRRPISTGARGRCRWCFPSAIRSGFISATRNCSARATAASTGMRSAPISRARIPKCRRMSTRSPRRTTNSKDRAAASSTRSRHRRSMRNCSGSAPTMVSSGARAMTARIGKTSRRRRSARGRRSASSTPRISMRKPPTPRSTAIDSTIASRTSIARTTAENPGSSSSPASATAISSTPCAKIPQRKGLLYAATELGMYVSFDDGDHWQTLQANLPRTSVRDIDVHGDDLVIATHGRGFWIMDDITALRQLDRAHDARGNAPLRACNRDPRARRGIHRHAIAEGRAAREQSAERRDDRLRACQAREEGRSSSRSTMSAINSCAAIRAPIRRRISMPRNPPTRRNGFRVRHGSRRRPACTVSSGRCAMRNPPCSPTATPPSTASGRRPGATRWNSSSTASNCASRFRSRPIRA